MLFWRSEWHYCVKTLCVKVCYRGWSWTKESPSSCPRGWWSLAALSSSYTKVALQTFAHSQHPQTWDEYIITWSGFIIITHRATRRHVGFVSCHHLHLALWVRVWKDSDHPGFVSWSPDGLSCFIHVGRFLFSSYGFCIRQFVHSWRLSPVTLVCTLGYFERFVLCTCLI